MRPENFMKIEKYMLHSKNKEKWNQLIKESASSFLKLMVLGGILLKLQFSVFVFVKENFSNI